MKLPVLVLALALGGCASIGKAPIAAPSGHHGIARPAPRPGASATHPTVAPPTPAEQIKKRWYDRFKVHPRWFHD